MRTLLFNVSATVGNPGAASDCVLHLKKLPLAVAEAITISLGLPVIDWENYVGLMLEPFIPSIHSTYRNASRVPNVSSVTFVQQTSIAPTWWSHAPANAADRLDVKFKSDAKTEAWMASGRMALPIAHYSTGATSGWILTEQLDEQRD